MADGGPIGLTTPLPGVLWAEIDNPPANALDPGLYEALRALVGRVEADPDVRVMVLGSANPKIFVSGADLKRLDDAALRPEAVAARAKRAHSVFGAIEELPVPSVAVIEGHALGGGCELALACDFRLIDRENGRIGLPEARLGLIPAAGGTQRLPALVGPAKAAELMMLGKAVRPEEAERIGLVTAAEEDPRAAAVALAERLAAMPSESLRLIKECLRWAGPSAAGLERERAAALEAFASADAREGIAAFRDKRRPAFEASRPAAALSRPNRT